MKALVFQRDLYQQTRQQLTRLQSLGNTENKTRAGLWKGHTFEESNVSLSVGVGGEEKELTVYVSQPSLVSFHAATLRGRR